MIIENLENKKAAFVVYPSFLDALRALPDKDANEAIRGIIDYGILGSAKIENENLKIVLLPIFTGIDTQKRRYRNIQIMNLVIDDIYRRTVGATDKCALLKIEKLINSLKKMVVECQKQDLYLYQIAIWIEHLMRNPDMKRIVNYGYGLNDGRYESFLESSLFKSIFNMAKKEKDKIDENKKKQDGENHDK